MATDKRPQKAVKTVPSSNGTVLKRNYEGKVVRARPHPSNKQAAAVSRAGNKSPASANCIDLTGDSGLHIVDLSSGQSKNPIPVYNDVDDERIPSDFKFIKTSIEATRDQWNRSGKRGDRCTCRQGSRCEARYGCECARRSAEAGPGGNEIFFECSSSCGCGGGGGCPQKLDRSSSPAVEIVKDRHKGFVCRLQRGQAVLEGAFVCEFLGEILSEGEVAQRDEQAIGTYAMEVNLENGGTKFSIDPTQCGNESRFFSHSCDPNLEHFYIYGGERRNPKRPSIGLQANRNIIQGEELTIDYGDSWWEERDFRCLCGHRYCRFRTRGLRVSSGKVTKFSNDQRKKEQELRRSDEDFKRRAVH